MSSLGTLPPDGIRPILKYLDLNTLARLFATFDRNITRQLSAPDAIFLLRIKKQKAPFAGLLRYFLSSVTNVVTLEFGNGVNITAEQLLLLKTLNPRHLKLKRQFLSFKTRALLAKFQMDPSEETLANIGAHLLPNGFPNLALLTPRLESLDFNYRDIIVHESPGGRHGYKQYLRHLRDDRFDFEIPPTVTSLSVSNPPDPFPFPASLFERSPQTIRSLKLETSRSLANEYRGAGPLNLILSRFNCLESLSLIGVFMLEVDEATRFPPSLTSFEYLGPYFPVELLSTLQMKSSKLVDLSITSRYAQDPQSTLPAIIDLNELLPPTLRSFGLHLSYNFGHSRACNIINLPLTLDSLSLTLPAYNPDYMNEVRLMKNLAHLQLIWDPDFLLAYHMAGASHETLTGEWRYVIPPMLESLNSNFFVVNSEETISFLPSSLKTLSVCDYDPAMNAALLEKAPMCNVHLREPLKPKKPNRDW